MKKIIFILFAALSFEAVAQLDTLHIDSCDRDPRYFYWDSNWADVHWHSNAGHPGWGRCIESGAMQYRPIIARKFYIDSSLRVMGLAGIAYQDRAFDSFYDTVESHRVPEYFLLYEATDTSFVLLDSGRYDHHSPRYIYHLHGEWGVDRWGRVIPYSGGTGNSWEGYHGYFEIKETYFDKPYVVSDSFYVGATCYNSSEVWEGNQYIHERAHYPTQILLIHVGMNPPVTEDYPYFKVRETLPRRDRSTGETDTSHMTWEYIENYDGGYLCLWPILDTTGMFRPDKPEAWVCDTVEDFRLLDQQDNMAAFAWTQSNDVDVWQLSWGEEGIAPEEGTLAYATTNVKSVVGLQDSVVYTAFVRARCNDTLFSEWSAPLRFWKGINDTVSLLPHNTVEQLTYLYPNPAENSVTVACSFAMSLVELFALDGTKLISQPANGIMTQIDLTPFPKGTYMLRITTPAGTAIKKLVRR